MIELDMPAGAPVRFALQPIERVNKHRREIKPDYAVEQAEIEITTPLATALTAELAAKDVELAAFWKAESGHFRYDYVSFRASFRPPKRSEFECAWIEVELSAAGGGEGAIAYSLGPDRRVDISHRTNKVKVGSGLRLVSAEVAAEEGQEVREFSLRAWREHTASPYWELTRTATTPLLGTIPFHLIVRSPVKSRVTGRISVRAVIEKRTLFIVTTDPAAPLGNAVEFTLRP